MHAIYCVQYIFGILMLQKHLIVLIIGVYLRKLLNVILMLLWSVFSYSGIVNKYFVYVGVTNSPNSLLCLMVYDIVELCHLLFNIYMDELSCNLNQSYISCSMNGMIINHLMYADDTCIIAPSPSAIQELLDICADFAVSNFIILIEKRIKCVFQTKFTEWFICTYSLP